MAHDEQLFTIGYEGATLDAFLSTLQAHRIDRVLDVRELPLSRKPGFSKRTLEATLANAGIAYVHVRAAGNPLRHDRRDRGTVLRAYRAGLTSRVLTELASAIERRTALLCFERDERACHRSVLAEAWAAADRRRRVEHLHVPVWGPLKPSTRS